MQERLDQYRQKAYRETVKNIIPSDYIPFNSFQEAERSLYSFLKDPNQKGLLLLGDAFSGKTTLLHHFKEKLLEQKAETAFLPIACPVSQLDNLTALLKEKFAQYNIMFSADEMIALKEYSFVFILDDYEEQGYFPNVYIKGALAEWPKSKYIVSCCSSHLIHEEHYPLYFMPFHMEEPQPQQWVEIHLSPLTPLEIDDYLQHYTKENFDLLKEWLAKEPMLYDLLGNPFLLNQMCLLPSEDITDVQIICNHLMKGWFAEYAVKMSQQADARNEAFDATWLSHYSIALTRCVEEQKDNPDHSLLNSLVPNSRKVWFDHSRPEFRWGWRASPLIVGPGSHRYRFIGEAFLREYLSALQVNTNSVEANIKSKRVLEINQQDQATESLKLLRGALMNQKLHTGDRNKLGLMADSILRGDKLSEVYKDQLFSFVRASKNNSSVAILAANAITILNSSGISFSAMNLSNISVPYADLNMATFSHTLLKGACLNKVNLIGAYLNDADLEGTALIDVKFGEAPLFYFDMIVNCICYNSEGSQISVGISNVIILYDKKNNVYEKSYPELKGHNNFVLSIAFSPDGKCLASGSEDMTIGLWNVERKQLTDVLRGHMDYVSSIVFSPQGEYLASGSFDRTIRLWDIGTKQLIHEFKGHEDVILSVSFNPNGSYLASGGADNTARLWNTGDKELVGILRKHKSSVTSIAFSPDGKYLASGSGDMTVGLWNVESKQLVRELKKHTADVTSVVFSPDGKYLASGSEDTTVVLWNVESKQLICELNGHTKRVNSIMFSPDGKYLASGSKDMTMRLWDIESKEFTRRPNGHDASVSSVVFSPDGKYLASGSYDATVVLWNIENKQLIRRLKGHLNSVLSIAFSSNGKYLASGSDDMVVRLWNVKNEQLIVELNGHGEGVTSVAFSPDGKYLASGSDDMTIGFWDIKTKKLFFELKGHSGSVLSIAFNPNGNYLASCGKDMVIRIWDIEGRKLACNLKGHTEDINSIAFSPDGKYLASGSTDMTVGLWNVESKQLVGSLKGHTGGINSIAFSPDGKYLASGSTDMTVGLWNVESKQLVDELKGQIDSVLSIAFSFNGNHLASASIDYSICLWEKMFDVYLSQEKWVLIYRFSKNQPLLAYNSFFGGAKISKENSRLLKQHGANNDYIFRDKKNRPTLRKNQKQVFEGSIYNEYLHQSVSDALLQLGKPNSQSYIEAFLKILGDQGYDLYAAQGTIGQLCFAVCRLPQFRKNELSLMIEKRTTGEVTKKMLSFINEKRSLQAIPCVSKHWKQLYEELIGKTKDEIIKTLIQRLNTATYPSLRQTAAETLGEIGSSGSFVIEALIQALSDTDPGVRQGVLNALDKLNKMDDSKVIQAHINNLLHTDLGVKLSAAKALGRLSSADHFVVEALVRALNDTHLWIKKSALEALGGIGSSDSFVIEVLIQALSNTDLSLIQSVLNTLDKLNKIDDSKVIQAHINNLLHINSNVRQGAAEALIQLGILDGQLEQALILNLKDTDSFLRKRAVVELGKLGRENDLILGALIQALSDTDSGVRQRAEKILSKLGELKSEEVAQAYRHNLYNRDIEVKQKKAESLVQDSILFATITTATNISTPFVYASPISQSTLNWSNDSYPITTNMALKNTTTTVFNPH